MKDNEKILKNNIEKINKKYETEIEKLNKKIKYYENLLFKDEIEKDKNNNTIYCKSSRAPINTNPINNYSENKDTFSNMNTNKTYRNKKNNNCNGNNNTNTNNSICNPRTYDRLEKYITNKFSKIKTK